MHEPSVNRQEPRTSQNAQPMFPYVHHEQRTSLSIVDARGEWADLCGGTRVLEQFQVSSRRLAIQYHRTEDPDRGGTNWWLHMHYSNGVGYGPRESDKYDGLVVVRGGEVGYESRSWQRVKSFAFEEPLREGDFLTAFSRVSADVAFE